MKIAIKVHNEYEIGFLMGVYKLKGLFPHDEKEKEFSKEFCIIPYEETNWSKLPESNKLAYREYEVVSFETWAHLSDIDVPKCIVFNQGNYKVEVYENNCYVTSGETKLYFTPENIQQIVRAFEQHAS